MTARVTARLLSIFVLFVSTLGQVLLAVMAVLGCAVALAAVAKLIWLALNFGWRIW